MAEERWFDVGSVEDLGRRPITAVRAGTTRIALSHRDGVFGAVSDVCNHAGGPLGEGALEGDYLVCPWHQWKFHRVTGLGEPGFEADRVPAWPVKVEGGRPAAEPGRAHASGSARRTRRIPWSGRSSGRPAGSGSSASRPRRWTRRRRASPAPTTCWRPRCRAGASAARRRACSASRR